MKREQLHERELVRCIRIPEANQLAYLRIGMSGEITRADYVRRLYAVKFVLIGEVWLGREDIEPIEKSEESCMTREQLESLMIYVRTYSAKSISTVDARAADDFLRREFGFPTQPASPEARLKEIQALGKSLRADLAYRNIANDPEGKQSLQNRIDQKIYELAELVK
jgi:hypothetical protein